MLLIGKQMLDMNEMAITASYKAIATK